MHSASDSQKSADDSLAAGPAPKSVKRSKVYRQKYNHSWESDPKLKGWLTAVKRNPYKAYCKACGKELSAGLSELNKHAETKNTKKTLTH